MTFLKNVPPLTDFLKFEKTLKEMGCKYLSLQGNDARSFEPTFGPYKDKVWSVILVFPIHFYYDQNGKYIGNDRDEAMETAAKQLKWVKLKDKS